MSKNIKNRRLIDGKMSSSLLESQTRHRNGHREMLKMQLQAGFVLADLYTAVFYSVYPINMWVSIV